MDKKEPIIIVVIVSIFVMAAQYGIGNIWDKYTISSEEGNLEKLLLENKDLKERIGGYKTFGTLRPGNEPEPPETVTSKIPTDAIKLYLGRCISWWKPDVFQTYKVVNINNEPVLSLRLEEKGLFISAIIRRREDGREVINISKNTYKLNTNVSSDLQRPNKHELIVSGKSEERLLYVNYLNEKAIAIEGTFYDSLGNWILKINDSEIVDRFNNRFLPGASFGGNENLFTYNTLLQPYQLSVSVTEPALIDVGYRIDYMHDGKIVENPSEVTIIISNTGLKTIRLGFDGEMEVAISGQVLDLKMSPPMEKSDHIEWNGKTLKFTSLIINPGGTKTINILMQGEGKCDISHATLRVGKVIVK